MCRHFPGRVRGARPAERLGLALRRAPSFNRAMTHAARELVSAFIAHIHAHEVDALAALLSAQHRFTDSLGAVVCGRESLHAGWRAYFKMVPDDRIRVARVLAQGEEVLLVGEAGGNLHGRWRPAS